MKYLKLFESFNKKWEMMSDDEFWRKESEFKLIPFNQEEWDKIKSILSPLFEDDTYSMEWAQNANTPNTIIDVREFNEDRLFEIWKWMMNGILLLIGIDMKIKVDTLNVTSGMALKNV